MGASGRCKVWSSDAASEFWRAALSKKRGRLRAEEISRPKYGKWVDKEWIIDRWLRKDHWQGDIFLRRRASNQVEVHASSDCDNQDQGELGMAFATPSHRNEWGDWRKCEHSPSAGTRFRNSNQHINRTFFFRHFNFRSGTPRTNQPYVEIDTVQHSPTKRGSQGKSIMHRG